MRDCEQHRQYLAAIADGEAELIPDTTLSHVAGCPDCSKQVEAHRLLGARLRDSVNADQLPSGRLDGRRWRVRLGAAAVAVAALAGAAFGWHVYTGVDSVAAAAAVAGDQPQYRSSDASSIGSWCQRASGRPMREVEIADLSPVGARVDRRSGTDIVTVIYATAEGDRINISWLGASQAPTGSSNIQTRAIAGRTVLIVASPGGTAVVSGSAPLSSLWATAAGLEAGVRSTSTRTVST
jgi:hypothetical protein